MCHQRQRAVLARAPGEAEPALAARVVEALVDLLELRQDEHPEEDQHDAQRDEHHERVGDRPPKGRAQALDELEVAAQAQQHAGQVAAAHARVDQPAVERGELAAVLVEGLAQRRAALEFLRHLLDRARQAAPAHVAGDKPQAVLDGQAGAGELRELLVEGGEVVAAERAGGGPARGVVCGFGAAVGGGVEGGRVGDGCFRGECGRHRALDARDFDHPQSHRLEPLDRRVGVGGVGRAVEALAVVRLRLEGERRGLRRRFRGRRLRR